MNQSPQLYKPVILSIVTALMMMLPAAVWADSILIDPGQVRSVVAGPETDAFSDDCPCEQNPLLLAADNSDDAPWHSPDIYPSVDVIPNEEAVNKTQPARKWNRPLPFMAQKVLDLGFDLPHPFGVGLVYAYVKQDLVLENLRISVGLDSNPTQPLEKIDAVSFQKANAHNNSVQMKLDAWLFPFLNVFGIIGYVDGEADIDLSVDIDQLFPVLCRLRGGCGSISGRAKPDYEGINLGVGTNIAAGWKRFFGVLNVTYVYSDLDITDSEIKTLNVSPRVGITTDLGQWGGLAFYTGATYLKVDLELTGRATIPIGDDLGFLGNNLEVDYAIDQRNKDRWNFLVGGNWDIAKSFSLQAEVGFGGSRENVISSVTYRF